MIEYLTVAVIALLASISPGPDFVVVTKNAIAYDRRMAVLTSLGIGMGILIHTIYCVLGLGLILANSSVAYSIIKYVGAFYLIYLGIKSVFSKKSSAFCVNSSKINSMNYLKAFREGLITNALNPKVTLFMLSMFTMVINPYESQLVQVSYGVEIALITGSWFVFLSLGLTHQAVHSRLAKAQNLANKTTGILLILIGIIVIFRS